MIEVFDFDQNTDEWLRARLGIPTASKFGTIMAQGRAKGDPSKTRREYLMKLLGERMTGEPAKWYSNDDMERGHEQEPEARDLYVYLTDAKLRRVGFIRNGDTGCSPDSLIDDDGILEIKSKAAHLQAEILLSGEVPSVHIPQLQGQLWVSGRKWVDLMTYCPRMPEFIVRVYRDDAFITRMAREVDVFVRELNTYHATLTGAELRVA